MNSSAQRHPISVSELSRRIRLLLEQQGPVWVEGELGQISPQQSGHVYLSLKDQEARISAVVWRNVRSKLRYEPGEGSRVLIYGRLSVYAPKGGYQLVVEHIEPAGQGAMQQAFEALKARLAAEGFFAQERKRRLPLLPRRVGVITSPTSAARRDIEAVLHRRSPQIPILLYPALVQGEQAAADLVAGLWALSQAPGIDLIILARGGGSAESLWAFNDERLARSIAACPLPVITGVGHETDITIADLVADLRAATPSEAAEKAVPVRQKLFQDLDLLWQRMEQALFTRMQRARQLLLLLQRRASLDLGLDHRRLHLSRLSRRLEGESFAQIRRRRLQLEALAQRLRERDPARALGQARLRLESARARLLLLGPGLCLLGRRRLEHYSERLERATQTLLNRRRSALAQLLGPLRALSPLASLERGYSITLGPKGAVTEAESLSAGDTVQIRLYHGQLEAVVTAIRPPEHQEKA